MTTNATRGAGRVKSLARVVEVRTPRLSAKDIPSASATTRDMTAYMRTYRARRRAGYVKPPRLRPGFATCAQCHQEKAVEEFTRQVRNVGGVGSWCKPCHAATNRAWRTKAGEALLARRRATYIPNTPRYTFTCPGCGVIGATQQPHRLWCSDTCASRFGRRAQRDVRVPQRRRQKILNRDGWQCYLCDRAINREMSWPHPLSGTVDHVVPVMMGGKNDPANLRAAHWQCNKDKGDNLPPWWVAA